MDAVRRILSAHGAGVGVRVGEKTRQLAGGARLDHTGHRDHGVWLSARVRRFPGRHDRVRMVLWGGWLWEFESRCTIRDLFLFASCLSDAPV